MKIIKSVSCVWLLSVAFGSLNAQLDFDEEVKEIVADIIEIFEENARWEIEMLFDDISQDVVKSLEVFTQPDAQEPPAMPIEAIMYEADKKANEFFSKAQTTVLARTDAFSKELRILNRSVLEDLDAILAEYGMKPAKNVLIEDVFSLLDSFQDGLSNYANSLLSTFKLRVRDKLQEYLVSTLGTPTYPEPELAKKRSFFQHILSNAQDFMNGIISAAKDDRDEVIQKTINETKKKSEIEKFQKDFKKDFTDVPKEAIEDAKKGIVKNAKTAKIKAVDQLMKLVQIAKRSDKEIPQYIKELDFSDVPSEDLKELWE